MPHDAVEIPGISTFVLRFFRRLVRSYFQRHFRSVMLQGGEALRGHAGPLIVFGNHSSWWDPMILVLLASELMPTARHYAPIDASALARYPILRRLGLFPVNLSSPRGAVEFLRRASAILSSGGVLWITPQGRFADVRERPLRFRQGLGTLAVRLPSIPLIPLATEYTFWDERLPEALARFGEPVALADRGSAEIVTSALEAELQSTMDSLVNASCARDASAFQTLLTGGRGTGGFYALGRRLRAFFAGHHFQPDHTER